MKSPVTAAVLALFLVAPLARAAFTIDSTVTTPQTLSSGTGLITATGDLEISGANVAITVTGASTIENNGKINQSGNGRGIRDNTGGFAFTINNNSGGTIQTSDGDSIQSGKANSNVTLNNAGRIISLNASGGGQAVDWNSITTGANVLHNTATGFIEAFEADAVRTGVNGIVTNQGTIKAVTSTASSSDGIDAQNNSGLSVTNTGSGLIEGGRHGITGAAINNTVNFTMSVTNGVGATIQGDDGSGMNIDGFNNKETVTVMNDGTITGNGVTGDGDGVDVDGVVNLTNTGTIKSLNSFSATPGGTSEGVTVGGGTIVNSGLIEGDVANGNANAVGRGINLAGGLIEGGGATAAALQTSADNDTVNNAGQIIADASNLAIDLGAGNDTLNITGGTAAVTGDISGGAGTNSLTIDPGTGNNFSYTGVISNFSTAEVKSGKVTLSGASTYTGNTTVSGGTLVAHNSTGSATGSGQVTVQNGATLAGDGRIGGDVILASGGTISPGLSPGNLRLDASLTLTNGSQFVFELGPGSDLVTVAGSLIFAGTGQAILNISDAGIAVGSDYTLITFANSSNLGLTNFTFGNTPAGFSGTLGLNGSALTLHVDTVPEPSSIYLLLGTLLGALVIIEARRSCAQS